MEIEEELENANIREGYYDKRNFSELCRVCANTNNPFIPIYGGEGLEHNILRKIEQHLPIIKVSYLCTSLHKRRNIIEIYFCALSLDQRVRQVAFTNMLSMRFHTDHLEQFVRELQASGQKVERNVNRDGKGENGVFLYWR